MVATSVCTVRPTLQQGSKGDDVKALQQQLNQYLGFREQLIVDGDFGPKTTKAVRVIQYRYFLGQDGIVGRQTWQVLCTGELIAQPLLKRGDRDSLIARVQQVLKAAGLYRSEVDGIFGLATEDAVIALQHQQNLSLSGKTDADTWFALRESAIMQTAFVS